MRLRADAPFDFVDAMPGVVDRRMDKQDTLVQLAEGTDPQALLELAVGRVKLNHFEVVRPTLHDIFIKQVGADPDEPTTSGTEVTHA